MILCQRVISGFARMIAGDQIYERQLLGPNFHCVTALDTDLALQHIGDYFRGS